MTAHKATPSHNRRRRLGPEHAAERQRGKGPLWGGLAALTVLGAAGFTAVEWEPPAKEALPTATETGATARPEPTPDRSRTTPAPNSPSSPSSSSPPTGASPRPSRSGTTIPATGPGTFVTASGGSGKVGTGKTLRYRVEVETGLALSAAEVAEEVERILADPRGWTADGTSAFRRVSGGTTDFVVRVATPGTVDKICGQYGLNTGGEVNCNVDDNVMVNLKRWELATPVYAKDVPSYRALIINHEVGHFLGHGHVGCPGPGKPAPAMMQQIKGMQGCVPNVWPYDAQGRLITGPAVP
ncbi:DUF3152 domain-containing protein [Streptomyces aurantiogriseus]|uniref:DUF3152 domain-containing protein n=1 Tax=Streptomyces aurantiogriseus TaxID=66870 RepID=A0A918CJ51_9ACTN|nr:DUF3152 domain-containing protein [Streptomyces aurantiogriseus]GGR27894.1 hypothetical protein GCM10010251_49910 [Streptomyces aurantiogriseus]